jgi:Transposase DDE domain
MAIASVLARLRREPLDDCALAQRVGQLCAEHAHVWRDRLLTPVVTVRLMLIQVLFGNTAITHLRQLGGLDFTASSYCEARQRLPLAVLRELVAWVARAAVEGAAGPALLGVRVLVADCSSFSMPDTAPLRGFFGRMKARGAKAGVTYPVAKVIALMDAATGLFTELLAAPLYTHDQRHTPVLHALLRPGDVLLGDRAYCSYGHLALLHLRGVLACFRLHQRRKDIARGVRRWRRPKQVPAWLTRAQWLSLPKVIDVRLISYIVPADRGFRPRRITIATTLFDTAAWPDAKIAELYGQRWRIETSFAHLKTTMGMNVLKCQSVDGVKKELAAYLLAYNLVRLAMLRAAERQGQSVWRISFIDALRWLQTLVLGLSGTSRLIEVPHRPGRSNPRVIRRRAKEYDLMTKPREAYKNTEKQGENA